MPCLCLRPPPHSTHSTPVRQCERARLSVRQARQALKELESRSKPGAVQKLSVSRSDLFAIYLSFKARPCRGGTTSPKCVRRISANWSPRRQEGEGGNGGRNVKTGGAQRAARRISSGAALYPRGPRALRPLPLAACPARPCAFETLVRNLDIGDINISPIFDFRGDETFLFPFSELFSFSLQHLQEPETHVETPENFQETPENRKETQKLQKLVKLQPLLKKEIES